MQQSELGAHLKMGLKGFTGPTSYDITAGSVADFSGGAAPFSIIHGAAPIHDTGAAASIIRTGRYQRAALGAPATGTVRFMDGAAGANVETVDTTALQTILQTWLAIGA